MIITFVLSVMLLIAKRFVPLWAAKVEKRTVRVWQAKKIIAIKVIVPLLVVLLVIYPTWRWFWYVYLSLDVKIVCKVSEMSQKLGNAFIASIACVPLFIFLIWFIRKTYKGLKKSYKLIVEEIHDLEDTHHHTQEDFFD